jgi:hypothetical protein
MPGQKHDAFKATVDVATAFEKRRGNAVNVRHGRTLGF